MLTKTKIKSIIIVDSKLLMLKGKGYNELWFPGGTIEEGESEEKCLRRELREEIGVELVSMEYFGEYSGKSPYHEYISNNKVYITEIKGEIKPSREIEDYVWLTAVDFHNKKYPMISINEEEIIPDLIKKEFF